MPVIQFRRHAKQVQVEDFPKDCERTNEGAMYVRPGATAVVTDAELKHLMKNKIPLLVVAKSTPKPAGAQESAQEPVQEPAGAPVDEGAGDAPEEPPEAPQEAQEAPQEAPEGSGKGKKRDKKSR